MAVAKASNPRKIIATFLALIKVNFSSIKCTNPAYVRYPAAAQICGVKNKKN
jgi:hypothetical protein